MLVEPADGVQVGSRHFDSGHLAGATLDAYSETGDPIHALAYGPMDVDTATAVAGLRVENSVRTRWGRFVPRLRFEYQRDFADDTEGGVRYADLPGSPTFGVVAGGFDRTRMVVSLGAGFELADGWHWALEAGSESGAAAPQDGVRRPVATPY